MIRGCSTRLRFLMIEILNSGSNLTSHIDIKDPATALLRASNDFRNRTICLKVCKQNVLQPLQQLRHPSLRLQQTRYAAAGVPTPYYRVSRKFSSQENPSQVQATHCIPLAKHYLQLSWGVPDRTKVRFYRQVCTNLLHHPPKDAHKVARKLK